MSTSPTTASDFFKSLNGFDEIAIAGCFGMDLNRLREQPFTFLRALAFVDKRREGMKDREAHEAALSLSIGDLEDYFPKDTDLDEDDDDTASAEGNDEQP